LTSHGKKLTQDAAKIGGGRQYTLKQLGHGRAIFWIREVNKSIGRARIEPGPFAIKRTAVHLLAQHHHEIAVAVIRTVGNFLVKTPPELALDNDCRAVSVAASALIQVIEKRSRAAYSRRLKKPHRWNVTQPLPHISVLRDTGTS
jgi:hypothetical protein